MTIAPVRPDSRTLSDGSIQVLIEEARQHRRRRLITWLVAVVVLGGVIAAALVGFNSGGSGQGRVSLSSATPNPAIVGPFSTIRSEMLAYLLPTSGADFTSGNKFGVLMNGVRAQSKAACLSKAGYSSVITYSGGGSAVGDNTEFPNIGELSSRGFILTGPATREPSYSVVNAGAQLTGRVATSYRSARSQCGDASFVPFTTMMNYANPLTNAWENRVVPGIDSSPAFQGALVGWLVCVRAAWRSQRHITRGIFRVRRYGGSACCLGSSNVQGRCTPGQALRHVFGTSGKDTRRNEVVCSECI